MNTQDQILEALHARSATEPTAASTRETAHEVAALLDATPDDVRDLFLRATLKVIRAGGRPRCT